MPLTSIIILVIASLVAPVVLIPIETFIPYPAFIEELVKAALIAFLVQPSPLPLRNRTLWAGIMGGLFGLSETMFYLGTQLSNGTAGLWWQRFFVTVPLHIVTAGMIAAIAGNRRALLPVGFMAALFVHFVFNASLI